jgi:glycosyltransferase involved in cell wall biosynthesis
MSDSESNKSITVVIPFYNEEDNVNPLLDEVIEALDGSDTIYEIICVDDGSSDTTAEKLSARADNNELVKVVFFRRNFGQTAAMMAGVDHAKYEINITMDGDRQNDPRDIPKLVDALTEEYSCVSGWRKDRKDATLTRTFPSRVANWIVSKVSGVTLHDFGCSLKAYRRDIIQEINLYGEMHRFIPIYCSWVGGKVKEIEVNHRARVAGISKYGMERVIKVLFDVLVIKFLGDFRTKPIHMFGMASLICLILSFASGAYAVYLKFAGIASFIQTPLPLLTVLCLVLGAMFLMMGLVAELVVRVYFEAQSKPIYHVRNTRNLDT